MNHAQTVKVEIYNHVYTIRAEDGDGARTQALAALVDKSMRDIARGAATADTLKVAILAALHIADQLDRANARHDELNEELSRRSAECVAVLEQVLKAPR